MHSFSLAATTLFAAGALAGGLNQLVPRELQVRQDQSFAPTTSFGQGATCSDAFGAGYIDCNGVCYNPGAGETCCSGNGDACERHLVVNKETSQLIATLTDPCPSDSFCLINGLCCPNGLPASTCAAQNGVTLPQDFSTDTATSAGVSTQAQTPKPTVSAVESTASSSSVFVPSTTAVVATPFPIPGNATGSGIAAPTGTGAPPPVTPFTGGAGSLRGYGEGLVAGFLGVVGLLLL
ncbi:MAG: hypothetical protein LQ338_002567 [Usnochroma carphineum]|nr:MAG: hypothetical protein LQ338_002567 [Usnochroma carphineum]